MAQSDETHGEDDIRLEATGAGQPAAPAVPVVVLLNRGPAEAIWEHANSDLTKEVGGVLVGRVIDGPDGQIVDVETALPAQEAEASAVHITFTHEAWEHWHKLMDKHYAGHVIVGWYHSHPSYGIFLSGDDTFIQENFFNQPWQIAVVVDPVRKEMGTFGWESGRIARHDEMTFQTLQRKTGKEVGAAQEGTAAEVAPLVVGEFGEPEGMSMGQRLWWLGWGVAAAFFLFAVLQTADVRRMTTQVKAISREVAAMQQSLEAELRGPRDTKTAPPAAGSWYAWAAGDTWDSVAQAKYGRADLGALLRQVNAVVAPTPMVGTQIWVPARDALVPPAKVGAPAPQAQPAGP